MQHTVFRVSFAELENYRLACRKPGCGSAFEGSLTGLKNYLAGYQCKCAQCGGQLLPVGDPPVFLDKLQLAVEAISKARALFDLEIVLPTPDRDSGGRHH